MTGTVATDVMVAVLEQGMTEVVVTVAVFVPGATETDVTVTPEHCVVTVWVTVTVFGVPGAVHPPEELPVTGPVIVLLPLPLLLEDHADHEAVSRSAM